MDSLCEKLITCFCKDTLDNIDQVLQEYSNIADDWEPYAEVNPQTLVKQRIYYHEGTFEVMLLSWPPGYTTLPHDHALNGCWLLMLQGALLETRYSQDLQPTSTHLLTPFQTSYMHNRFGYHSIRNANTDGPTWSLHVYSPPSHITQYFK